MTVRYSVGFTVLQRRSFMNNKRIGEYERTGTNREHPWHNLESKFGSGKWEKLVSVPLASPMTQGIFVGHHDRTGAVLWITNNGVVRGNSLAKQPLNDAWDAANWDGLCGTLWQMVAPELTLTKKKYIKKKEAGLPLPRLAVERIPQVEPRRFHVLSAGIEARGHTGSCLGCAVLASHGRASKLHNKDCREKTRTIIETTLTGMARKNAQIDRAAERLKARKRARVERGAWNVPMELWNEDQMSDRHAVAY